MNKKDDANLALLGAALALAPPPVGSIRTGARLVRGGRRKHSGHIRRTRGRLVRRGPQEY